MARERAKGDRGVVLRGEIENVCMHVYIHIYFKILGKKERRKDEKIDKDESLHEFPV